MAVYKRTYKVYQGGLTPAWSRFSVLTRYSLSTLFTSRLFTAFFVLSFLPFLIAMGYIYLAHSQIAQSILGIRGNGSWVVNNTVFVFILRVQAGMGFVLVAWSAPGMIARDITNQALQLYFSRPLSRVEYIIGKFAVMAFLISCITWIPDWLLFGLQAGLAGHGWGWDNFYLLGAIFVSSWLWIAVISFLALALSVFVRWRIAATGLIFGVMLLLPGLGNAFNLTLKTHWGSLLDLSDAIRLVWIHLFRIHPRFLEVVVQDDLPFWAAWISIFSACAISFFLLNRRLKAREVVRG